MSGSGPTPPQLEGIRVWGTAPAFPRRVELPPVPEDMYKSRSGLEEIKW